MSLCLYGDVPDIVDLEFKQVGAVRKDETQKEETT